MKFLRRQVQKNTQVLISIWGSCSNQRNMQTMNTAEGFFFKRWINNRDNKGVCTCMRTHVKDWAWKDLRECLCNPLTPQIYLELPNDLRKENAHGNSSERSQKHITEDYRSEENTNAFENHIHSKSREVLRSELQNIQVITSKHTSSSNLALTIGYITVDG